MLSIAFLFQSPQAILTRDSLDIGLPDPNGLDLLSHLLRWDPAERITAAEALKHPYFASEHAAYTLQQQHVHDLHRHAGTAGVAAYHPDYWSALYATQQSDLVPTTQADTQEAVSVIEFCKDLQQEPFSLDMQHSLVGMSYTCGSCARTFDTLSGCEQHSAARHRDAHPFCSFPVQTLPSCIRSVAGVYDVCHHRNISTQLCRISPLNCVYA